MQNPGVKRRGIFISFEGGDGSGKSTQLSMLRKHLQEEGCEARFIREPGGTPIGEKIRDIILDKDNALMTAYTEALLYAASRSQVAEEIIKPELEQGRLVICDRFVDSSMAYQGFGRGLGTDFIKEINKVAISDCVPDLTVFLDIVPVLAFERLGNKNRNGKDRLETESMNFHMRVYRGYKKLIANEVDTDLPKSPRKLGYRQGRFLVLDAGSDPKEISQVICSEVDSLLRERGYDKGEEN